MTSLLDSAALGQHRPAVEAALDALDQQQIVRRIWDGDHTVWKPEPTEIADRLGWLRIVDEVRINIRHMAHEVREARGAGYRHVLLLGMGGSSLAPALFGKLFASKRGMALAVLDSTDPAAVLASDRLDPRRTLFIVSSKSGTTVEVTSLFKHHWNRALAAVGPERAAEHFIAITDKGTPLAELAGRLGFRATFLNNPHLGGRYSALSFFGLVPAAYVGVDLPRLLDRAAGMAHQCRPEVPLRENPGAVLGVILGALAGVGIDKLTLITEPAMAPFGDWVEQLIAESIGKEGKGILPVVGEAPGDPSLYGADRLFVQLRLAGNRAYSPPDEALLDTLTSAGHPALRLKLSDLYDLGAQVFLWEFATAVAGHVLGINPFDQPNVEAAKRRATALANAYRQSSQLPPIEPAPVQAERLLAFLDQALPGDYIALQAFLPPTDAHSAILADLRAAIWARTGCAVTVGYGPRYLHSTGQLHKGDAGRGLFITLTGDPAQDVPIPDQPGSEAASISFGILELAQALGDMQALREAGRRVIHFHLGADIAGGLASLVRSVA